MAKSIYTITSKKNPYYISKHRYLELKHFCLQYPEWKKRYRELEDSLLHAKSIIKPNDICTDVTSEMATEMAELKRKMDLVEKTAIETDSQLANYIFEAVTRACTYEYFQTQKDIPCCRDTFYSRYRKYFWMLNSN